jgi:hypothetical protein
MTTQRLIFAITAAFLSGVAAAEPASGTINYQSKAGPIVISVAHVYLVKGPDAVTGKTIRQLVVAPADIGAKLQACATISCVSGNLMEGMTVDFDAGPRLNYWVVANGQKVQYSGTAKPDETLKLTADTADQLAGTLTIDDSKAGGAKVTVKFDAKTAKQFSK